MIRQGLLRASISVANRRAMSSALPFEQLPAPPPDSKKYDSAPEPTHVEFFMGSGGPTRMHDVQEAFYHKIGDIARYRFPGDQYQVMLFDPDEMLKIHKASGPTPLGSTTTIWPFMEFHNNLQKKYKGVQVAFVTDGTAWKDLRHKLQKGLFGHEDSKSYVPLFNGVVKEAVSRFPANSDNIFPFLNRTTFEIIHSVLFGMRANAIDPSKALQEDTEFINATFATFSAGPILQYDPLGKLIPHMDKLPKEMTANISKEALAAWEAFKNDSVTILDTGMKKVTATLKRGGPVNPGDPDCLVLRYVKDGALSTDEVALSCAGLLNAGVDTTANSIMWVLTRLAEYPEAQEKVRKEIQAVQKARGDPWNAEQLLSLKLASSFFDECMRFVATAQGHMRTPIEDCEVTSRRTGKKYIIPKGTMVVFGNHSMGSDPKYVTNPDKFQAERFTRECKHARRGTPEALIDSPVSDVFSFGPRMCLGARLARLELLNVTAEVLENYKVEFKDPNTKVGITNAFLSRPDPLPAFKFTEI